MSKKKTGKKQDHNFRSQFEEDIWNAAGRDKTLDYETLRIPYIIKASYLPDFHIKKNKIIIEAKGRLDAATCRKMRAVKASRPDLDIRFVFYDANKKLNKRSKMRHWEWAERYGFPWCEGRIPREWLEEESSTE